MAAPQSLLKYDDPVVVNAEYAPEKSAKVSSPRSPLPSKEKPANIKYSSQQVLNTIFPPRQWAEGEVSLMQHVSTASSTKEDVIQLGELLDAKLQQRRAKRRGICPIRRDLYSQCFDELIRQETLNCPERGLLLACIRDEFQMNIAAHKTLYEDSIAFGTRETLLAEEGMADMEQRICELEEENRELKRHVMEQMTKYEITEKKTIESQQLEEKRHNENIMALERSIQQLQDQMEEIATLKD